jgi:hypothetical protein
MSDPATQAMLEAMARQRVAAAAPAPSLLGPGCHGCFPCEESPGCVWAGGRLLVEMSVPLAAPESGIWDSSFWDSDAQWVELNFVDVTPWAREVQISRGRRPYSDRFETGTASLRFDNRDGRFSPWNRHGPYAGAGRSTIAPGLPVAVWWSHPTDPAGDPQDLEQPWIVRPLFFGLLESLDEYWPETEAGRTDAEVQMTLVDTLQDLAAYGVPPVDPAADYGELSGARIERLALFAGWRWETAIDPGTEPLLASLRGASAMELIQRAAEAEGGVVYAGPDGTLVFRDSLHPPELPQAVFTDDCSDNAQWADPGSHWDEAPWNENPGWDNEGTAAYTLPVVPYTDLVVACDDTVLVNTVLISNGEGRIVYLRPPGSDQLPSPPMAPSGWEHDEWDLAVWDPTSAGAREAGPNDPAGFQISDPTSISVHGERSYVRTDLEYANPWHGRDLAQTVLARRAWATTRIGAVSLDSTTDPLVAPTIAGVDLLSRVFVVRTFAQDRLIVEVEVEQIEHSLLPERWTCTFSTADVRRLDPGG